MKKTDHLHKIRLQILKTISNKKESNAVLLLLDKLDEQYHIEFHKLVDDAQKEFDKREPAKILHLVKPIEEKNE